MVQVAATNGLFETLNGAKPCEGTKGIPYILDFAFANAYLINLTQQWQQKQFVTLQTVWIDNSDNPSEFEIIGGTIGQRVVAPPFSQGYYALLIPVPFQLTVQSSGTVIVNIVLLNYYIPPVVWVASPTSANGYPQVDIPALDPLISNNGLNVNNTVTTLTALTDSSGTIAVGGTAQQALVSQLSRKWLKLANPSTATEVLLYGFGSTGVTPLHFFDLPAGQSFESGNGSACIGDELWVKAATAAHAFILYEKT